jgi:RNA polymerase sigma-70 factor (ECF subfamily)
MSDWPDVQASVRGDGEAYARLIRRYQDRIAAYMWRFSRDPAVCEELVHDVFVEAYLGLRGYRAQAPLLHWLRKIATRVGYRHWKRQARRRDEATLPISQLNELPERGALDARQTAEAVHVVLARMAARDRLVLTLQYLEGCSVAEIARLTGWNQALVKVQAHRARKRLKKLWEQSEVEP